MAYSDILAQIKGALESVPDLGVVRDYLRWWKTDADFANLMQATVGGKKRVQAWLITRDAVPSNQRYTAGSQHRLTHLFTVRGYLAVEDGTASEKTFQGLIDAVVVALDNAVTLGDTVSSSGPAVVQVIEHREVGNVLCHYCEIHLQVVENANRSYS